MLNLKNVNDIMKENYVIVSVPVCTTLSARLKQNFVENSKTNQSNWKRTLAKDVTKSA